MKNILAIVFLAVGAAALQPSSCDCADAAKRALEQRVAALEAELAKCRGGAGMAKTADIPGVTVTMDKLKRGGAFLKRVRAVVRPEKQHSQRGKHQRTL